MNICVYRAVLVNLYEDLVRWYCKVKIFKCIFFDSVTNLIYKNSAVFFVFVFYQILYKGSKYVYSIKHSSCPIKQIISL